jgi:putative methyltransferase (TIGR04325 family)
MLAMTDDWKTKLMNVPFITPFFERRYEKHFANSALGCFRGVYKSFDEANQTAPATKPLGFDNPAYAAEFDSRLSQVYSFDYPVLFWMRSLLKPKTTIFDFGGHRGTHFYSYAKYLEYPEEFRWIVCELPEIIEAGKQLARERGLQEISFTSDFRAASGADIFLAAGSLQYVERPRLHEMLKDLSERPPHLLINKLPLYEGREYVTLQNGGVAFHPQYVFNRKEFLEPLFQLGYELIDTWDVPSHAGKIPYHPEVSFRWHSGLYLRQTNGQRSSQNGD